MTAIRLALALIATAAALVITGLAMGNTGAILGALALIGAAWLVRDHTRTPQVTP